RRGEELPRIRAEGRPIRARAGRGRGTGKQQGTEVLARIATALEQAGASLRDVVRTRIFVTDIARWSEVAAAHSAVFGTIRPAASMYEVTALIAPELLIEIEADAIVAG
ncbi:Rid family hydrolase, partial [Amycolatopsis sp. NPDC003676]